MSSYTKPPLTIEDQIKLLQQRGLFFPDEQRSKRLLSNISYYRLSAYMLVFKPRKKANGDDTFAPGTTWDNVYDLYVFDRKLRLLIFDCIERIEIAIRTQIIHQLSLKYGPHWHDNPSLFKVETKTNRYGQSIAIDVYQELRAHLDARMSTSDEEFIQHYITTYTAPLHPPCWMSMEIVYFNHLSKICQYLRDPEDLKAISQYFGLKNPYIFCSWLHTINYVRNICAHHSRLWNRAIRVVPKKLLSPQRKWISNIGTVQTSRIYYFLCLINYFLQTVNPTNQLKQRLLQLFSEYSIVNPRFMGFPANWEADDAWR